MRNNSKIEDLAPSCTKIANNSADMYLSIGIKISRAKLKKLIPYLSGISSEESSTSTSEPLSIKGVEFSTIQKRVHKLPQSSLPKIEDVYNSKFLPSVKPLTEKIANRKNHSKKNLAAKREPVIVEKLSPRHTSRPKTKIITKVSYKEAARFPEWAMIAKPELEKIWKTMICVSNGIKPLPSPLYKFFVGKGNNSALIKRLMANRAWWVSTDNIEDANFVWTQWKDKNYLQTLFPCSNHNFVIDENPSVNFNYQVPVRMNNLYRQVEFKDLGLYKIKNSLSYTVLTTTDIQSIASKLYNKLEFNQHIANKKGLYKNLKFYYQLIGKNVFDCHPITFHVVNGEEDAEFLSFNESFAKFEKLRKKNKSKNVWIVKPGENSNRGHGIQVCKSLSDIKNILKDRTDSRTGQKRTFILQKYIEKPFLIHNRKFDIRCYSLITCINGILQGYFYIDGYIRTSCVEYNINETNNNFIHLTNDAVQKHSEDYGKYEDNNKMSYKDFQRYLDSYHPDKKINFFVSILPKTVDIVKDVIKAVFLKIDKNKRLHCMEIFGYDFMLDNKLKPWIIEVNTNPCLELSSSYLSYLIPTMLENAFRITLDTLFPSVNSNRGHEPIPENRFELIFHQVTDGNTLSDIFAEHNEDNADISDSEQSFPDGENV